MISGKRISLHTSTPEMAIDSIGSEAGLPHLFQRLANGLFVKPAGDVKFSDVDIGCREVVRSEDLHLGITHLLHLNALVELLIVQAIERRHHNTVMPLPGKLIHQHLHKHKVGTVVLAGVHIGDYAEVHVRFFKKA